VVAIVVLLAGTLYCSVAQASLSLSDFDAVAYKWDSGESASNTAVGVRAEPSPVYEGAVNLMMFNAVFPLYLTDGPNGEGNVSFGFVDHDVWTPVNGDGNSLTEPFSGAGDRVFVTVDINGGLELWSSVNFGEPVIIASGSVTPDPNTPFRLFIEPEFDWAYVFFGDEVVVEGNPFFGPGTMDRADLGSDFIISVGCLCDDFPNVGDATVNDLARDPTLAVYEFPQVMGQLSPEASNLRPIRPFPIALTGEEADLAVTLTNVGSATAGAIQVTMTLPAGTDFSFTDGATQDYGDLAPRTSTVRRFPISVGDTDMGVYPLSLSITSSGGSQTLETWLPVWADSVVIDDLDAGMGTTVMESPFGTHTIYAITPEVVDGQGMPDYFDLQHITHQVALAEPYLGAHWGDAEAIMPEMTGPATAWLVPETGNISGKVVELTPQGSGPGIAGCVVQLINLDSGAVVSQDVTGADGVYGLGPAEYGAYKIKVLFPRTLFNRNSTSESSPFELGVPALIMDDWSVVVPPIASAPAPNATPANGQGQVGRPTAGTPPPTATPPPPKNKGRAKSMAAGFGASLLCWGIDTFIAPETLGGSLASFLIGSGAGAGANLAVDPQGEDLFWLGEENTPPQTPGELTLEEEVVVDIMVDPPFSFDTPSTITTSFTYTRTTDVQTYTYSGSESLDYDLYLPMTLDAVHVPGTNCGQVHITATASTADGTPLTGPEVLIQAWLGDEIANETLGETLLRDDGQDPDDTAGDGIYSGSIAATCATNGRQVLAFASLNGFMPHNSPSSNGWLSLVMTGLAASPGDGPVPLRTQLFQNTPNPFNPSTRIRYDLARDGQVELTVFDVAGRLVRTLVDGKQTAGSHAAIWNGRDDAGKRVSSGVYFYRLQANGLEMTQKLVLTK